MDRITFTRSFRLSLALFALLALVVGVVMAWEWWQAQRLPSREPDLFGSVVEDGPTRLAIETNDSKRWRIAMRRNTPVQFRSGRGGALAAGQKVNVWLSGEVLESSPPIFVAEWVIVKDNEVQVQPQ